MTIIILSLNYGKNKSKETEPPQKEVKREGLINCDAIAHSNIFEISDRIIKAHTQLSFLGAIYSMGSGAIYNTFPQMYI